MAVMTLKNPGAAVASPSFVTGWPSGTRTLVWDSGIIPEGGRRPPVGPAIAATVPERPRCLIPPR